MLTYSFAGHCLLYEFCCVFSFQSKIRSNLQRGHDDNLFVVLVFFMLKTSKQEFLLIVSAGLRCLCAAHTGAKIIGVPLADYANIKIYEET